MEGDQRWVVASWMKCRAAIYEFLREVLLPEYELTVIQLFWKGSEQHSLIAMEIWRNFRTERLHSYQEILQPILVCLFYPDAKVRRRTTMNLCQKFKEDLCLALDWKPDSWENRKHLFSMLSALRKEDDYFGKY